MDDRSKLRHQQISRLAYELWEKNGRPSGSALSDWLLAEQIVELENHAKPPFGELSLEANEQ